MSTLKSGNKKTVNIEVRKKRTYVKRSDEELETQAKVEAEQEARTEPVAPQVEFGTGIDDIEEKRQSAIEKRRTAEVEAKQAEEAEKERLDEEAKKAAEAAVVAEQEATKKPAKPAKEAVVEQPAPEKGRRHTKPVAEEDDDKIGRKAAKKPSLKSKKKPRVELDDGSEERSKGPRLKSGLSSVLKVDNKHVFKKPVDKKVIEVGVPDEISVADLAQLMSIKSGAVVKELMKMGVMATINEVCRSSQ